MTYKQKYIVNFEITYLVEALNEEEAKNLAISGFGEFFHEKVDTKLYEE